MRYLGKRKGAVLIVVLGVLAVLALLATTFATLQATEKQVSRNYLDTVRAKLLAQSGVQDAEARLRDYFPFRYFEVAVGQPNTPRPWKFWGTSDDELTEPTPLDKLEMATNPSFAVEDESPMDPMNAAVKPKAVTIEGLKRGFSGTHGSGTYAIHGDQYALKINDISGRIYVNDGIDQGNDSSVSKNTQRILNILGEVLQVKLLGDKLLAARPQTGYRHQMDMLKAVNFDEAMFNRFKDYVTVHAWVDPNVANPVPLNIGMAQMIQGATGVKYERSNAGYRYGSDVQGVDAAGVAVSVGGGLMTCPLDCGGGPTSDNGLNKRLFGLDTLAPGWIEVVQRAPVNINAASREVLVALLTDLRGWFVAQRRRNNPRWEGDLYLSFKQQNALKPKTGSTTGDEYGYLMETYPIIGPGGTATDGISAYDLADEIIKCRNRQNSKWHAYSTEPWAGPFKTWNQFNVFIDNLVWKPNSAGAKLLMDTRSIHKDFIESPVDTTGHGPLVNSDPQKAYASQAIADVIKANFNPNLHLNETNPDANLFMIVDKTDLIVNSTEFTFMPTGFFEIESLGRILRPKDDKVQDVYLAGDNVLIAQAKVTAVYKFYDLYRETNQRQFYTGLWGSKPPRTGAFESNNNLSLEVGPEPDNGVFPGVMGVPGDPDSEWGGYVAFPTVGSECHSAPTKAPNTLLRTQSTGNVAHFNSAMHAHYRLDQDAHAHPAGQDEIAHASFANENVENYGDFVGGVQSPLKGPYNPTLGTTSAPVRIARSYRLVKGGSGTVTVPSLNPFLYSDLRIDGTYVERHSAPAYYNRNSAGIWDFGATTEPNASGMISMWVKPSFNPDLTGKVRTFWDMSRWHDNCGQSVNVWPWAIWYYPSNFQYQTTESVGPRYWHNNQGQFQPSSLVFGSKQWHSSSSGRLPRAHEFGRLSVTLNHLGHPLCSPSKRSPLKAHHWTNLTVSWHLNGADGSGLVASSFYVNGNMGYAPYSYTSMTGGWSSGHDRMYFFNQHDGGEYNHMRLGATSVIANKAKTGVGYKGNYTGDHTLDELYIWKAQGDASYDTLWIRGRYYKPTDAAYGEGVFTSQAMALAANNVIRQLPAASTSAAGPGGSGTAPSLPALTQMVRVLGLSWTWYGEPFMTTLQGGVNHDVKDPRNKAGDENRGQYQVLYNHQDETSGVVKKVDVFPLVQLGIKDGSQTYGPFDDDGFSAVRALNGTTPVMQDPKNAKYFAQFRLMEAGFDSILLATPVLDDVTVYWDDTQAHLLSYVFDGRTF